MIIYNITTNVSWAVHDEWLAWLQQDQIPKILETKCFYESRVLRLLEIDDEDGPTYAIQLYASSKEDYEAYVTQHASAIDRRANEKWGNEIIAFSSVMEVLH